jgi:hypothetical protein
VIRAVAKKIAGRSVRLDNVKPLSLRFNVEIVMIRSVVVLRRKAYTLGFLFDGES